MQGGLPTLLGLRVFEAAARHESFSLAAKELSVSQAAVSHQIRRLEEELGYKLFERRPRKVLLTADGKHLMKAVGRAWAEIRQALSEISSEASRLSVSISVSPSFANKWLVPRLRDFREAHPEIDLRVSSTTRMLVPGKDVDLCIRYGEGEYYGLHVEELLSEDVFIVCSPTLLKDEEKPLRTIADLAHHTLIHDEVFRNHPRRLGWHHWSEHYGLTLDAKSGLHFSYLCHAVDAAIAEQGVALGRGCIVVDDLEAGRLVRPFAASHPSPFSYWLVTSPRDRSRAEIKAFIQWLRHKATESKHALPKSLEEKARGERKGDGGPSYMSARLPPAKMP